MESDHIMTPERVRTLLDEGNGRFVSGKTEHPHCDPERLPEVATGQKPFAVIVGCSDSRVPPEIIFDRGIGDLFVVRVAGNVVDAAVMGSVTLAVNHFGCPLVVVLGHERCGAIGIALCPDDLLIREPVPVIRMVETLRANIPETFSRYKRGDAAPDAAVRENMLTGAAAIAEDPFIAGRVAEGRLLVVPAYYSLSTGRVEW